ncbi:hypothetical protein [Paenibacillus pabuli]|uniref:hypothetical protein n=1 Tax=Paenibacillus pabuli TaxID=1472 RepID=UPI001FFE6D30|nr:hypothetical protein [Paenibacillus pabuli]UPK44731.1 hypothetical protein KET34_04185 [Paenibacillus pabuli]
MNKKGRIVKVTPAIAIPLPLDDFIALNPSGKPTNEEIPAMKKNVKPTPLADVTTSATIVKTTKMADIIPKIIETIAAPSLFFSGFGFTLFTVLVKA